MKLYQSFYTTANIGANVNKGMPIWASISLFVVVILSWFGAGALVPDSVATDTAKGLGYTSIEVSDRSYAFSVFSGCGKGDIIKWNVSGTNPAGQHTSFTVCAGLFKGGTPRF